MIPLSGTREQYKKMNHKTFTYWLFNVICYTSIKVQINQTKLSLVSQSIGVHFHSNRTLTHFFQLVTTLLHIASEALAPVLLHIYLVDYGSTNMRSTVLCKFLRQQISVLPPITTTFLHSFLHFSLLFLCILICQFIFLIFFHPLQNQRTKVIFLLFFFPFSQTK